MIINGKIMWAKVNSTVDTYKGNEQGYSLSLYSSDKETKDLKAIITEMLNKAKSDPNWECAPGEKPKAQDGADTPWEYRSRLPIKKDKDGKCFITFKSKHKDKEGNRKYIDIFDKTGGRAGDDKFDDFEGLEIGNGSKGFVSFTPAVYWKSPINHGVKLFLNAIQLTDLVQRKKGGTAEGYGFTVSAPTDTDANDEIPV